MLPLNLLFFERILLNLVFCIVKKVIIISFSFAGLDLSCLYFDCIYKNWLYYAGFNALFKYEGVCLCMTKVEYKNNEN